MEKKKENKKKVLKVKFTPEQAKIEELHHKYRGKQRCKEAKAIRRQLRKSGIYISRLGHHGGLHD